MVLNHTVQQLVVPHIVWWSLYIMGETVGFSQEAMICPVGGNYGFLLELKKP